MGQLLTWFGCEFPIVPWMNGVVLHAKNREFLKFGMNIAGQISKAIWLP